jgi:cob(I)alamin adenosyltransferase
MSKMTTKLQSGVEPQKDDPILDVIGTVEELNAAIGVVLAYVWEGADAVETLMEVQKDLIAIVDDLQHVAVKYDNRFKHERFRHIQSQAEKFNEVLVEPKSAVIPGGTPASAHCHLARAVCRRAERAYADVVFGRKYLLSGNIGLYLNALDHLLFALARFFSPADKLLENETTTESVVSGTSEIPEQS